MAKKSKKYLEAAKKIDSSKAYSVEEAIALAKETDFAKFDASVEVAYRLGLDPKKADQQLRGAVVLPNGTGKTQRVLVFAKGEKAKEAEAAGADYVGDSELAQKIQGGWFEFDVIVATPDMMGEVGRLGRVLGPKGLMPNPKTGTVTMDVTKAVEEIKAGKVTYRVDKAGNIHVPIGKVSFSDEKLVENFKTIHETLLRIKPATVKGQYVRNVAVTTTFGPKRLYLSSIMDLYNGEILAYTIGPKQDTKFVLDTLNQIDLPKDVLLHSDQGSVYTSAEYYNLCKEKNIIRSMSRKGTPADNAPIESFHSSLKCEAFYIKDEVITSSSIVIQIVENYIKYYNEKRSQQKLDYLSPVEYRRR